MEKTDFLIIGCGLYGSVLAERIANILKKKVIIFGNLDKKIALVRWYFTSLISFIVTAYFVTDLTNK